MKHSPGVLCNTLHDTKQVLIRVPSSIWENQLATRIFPLAFGYCGYKVCGNWNATDVPVFRMPIEMRFGHDVQKSAFYIAVLCVTSLPITHTSLEKIIHNEPLLVGGCCVQSLNLLGVIINHGFFGELGILTLLQ